MAKYDRKIPYNDLPPLPPKTEIDSKEILRKVISASRALAQLDGALKNLPNPTLFLDTIHLQEAKASSEIENIITTNDDLYKSLVAGKKFDDPTTKEVLSYKEALWFGLERMKTRPFITTNLCIEIAQCIKKDQSSIRKTSGTTLSNTKGEIIYTPPEGEDIIRQKMADLEKFINNDESIDPLIKMALMHYQFEAIHPFEDGNGRTGRILLLLFLKISNLLDIPAIYLSSYIIKNKTEYYRKLRNVTEKDDWQPYIHYMLDMIEVTSTQSLERLEKIEKLMSETTAEIKEKLPKVYSKDLVEILFKLPYTKRQNLIDAGLGTPKTVGNYLIELEENGFLKSERVGKEKLYLNDRLLKVLEQE